MQKALKLLAALLLSMKLIGHTPPPSDFITEVNVSQESFTENETQMIERIISNRLYGGFKTVRIGDLARIQRDGRLDFKIPGRAEIISAFSTYVNFGDRYNYEWHGKTDEGFGSVILLCRKGKVTASISLQDGEYEIISGDNGNHFLIAHNTYVEIKDMFCGTDGTTVPLKFLDSVRSVEPQLIVGECIDFVRVLVLFTPAARQSVADINQTINLCISQLEVPYTTVR